jgi:anti-sigma factor (TIGR02949 family)
MSDDSCRHLLSSLSEYIDGTLDETLCAEIERHMSGCEDCQIVVDSLRKTISLYQRTSNQATIPDGLRERLFHRLKLDDYLSPLFEE